MNSLELFDKYIRGILRTIHFIGVEIDLARGKPFNWRLFGCVLTILLGSASAVYTVYIVNFDFILTLKCIGASTQAVVGTVKLIAALKSGKQMAAIITFLRSLYILGIKTESRRFKVMNASAENLKFLFKCGAIMYVIILMLVCFYPAYSVIFLREPGLFFEIQFIGFALNDETTVKGYILNYISQFSELFYGFVGNCVYDLFFFTCVLHVHTLIELQVIAFDECEEMRVKRSQMFDEAFRNCLVMIQDINNYILALQEIFSPVVFAEIICGAVAMGFSLFCIFTTDWLGAYGLFLMGFLQVLLYCVVGTALEILNERLAAIIYDFRWYLLSVRDQKSILFILMKAQTPSKLYIGSVAELNVSSAASIYKMIYSFLMMLLNFID